MPEHIFLYSGTKTLVYTVANIYNFIDNMYFKYINFIQMCILQFIII